MNKVFLGDCRDTMRKLIADGIRVQCIVTSPPYWGLRDYGCEGQIGLEPTLQEFIAELVEVFELCRQLLTDDGTCWINMGDSYADSGNGQQGKHGQRATRAAPPRQILRRGRAPGLKPKDLCGQPWRLAFALQDAGWWLRQDIIWHKPNPMPESIKDRCTKVHEYLFLLTKSERYYFDADAIAEPRAAISEFNGVGGWAGAGTRHDAISHNRDKGDAKSFRGGQVYRRPRTNSVAGSTHNTWQRCTTERYSQQAISLDDRHRSIYRRSLCNVSAGARRALHSRWQQIWRYRFRSIHGQRHRCACCAAPGPSMDRLRTQSRIHKAHSSANATTGDAILMIFPPTNCHLCHEELTVAEIKSGNRICAKCLDAASKVQRRYRQGKAISAANEKVKS